MQPAFGSAVGEFCVQRASLRTRASPLLMHLGARSPRSHAASRCLHLSLSFLSAAARTIRLVPFPFPFGIATFPSAIPPAQVFPPAPATKAHGFHRAHTERVLPPAPILPCAPRFPSAARHEAARLPACCLAFPNGGRTFPSAAAFLLQAHAKCVGSAAIRSQTPTTPR